MARDARQVALRLDGPIPDPAAGVFETTLVARGRAVEIDAHLARLEWSLRALYGLSLPARARALIEDAAAGLELGRLRLTVVPGLEPSVSVAHVDGALVFPSRDAAASLAPVVVPGWKGGHKWADRRMLDRAQDELGADLPLLVDPDGSVLEASRSNIFAARDGVVATPPLDGRLLPGVARARAIEVARAAGVELVERPLGLDELAEADEVFMTGGVRGVEPVRCCAGLAEWDSGEIAARVAAELRRAWLG